MFYNDVWCWIIVWKVQLKNSLPDNQSQLQMHSVEQLSLPDKEFDNLDI